MRGHPRDAMPEHRAVSTTPKTPPPQDQPRERVSTSRYARPPGAHSAPKPKVLMGEVTAPPPPEAGPQREAFRAAMIARRLSPTGWARAAGVPVGEVLGFLAGRARILAPQTLEKLARVAGCTPQDLLG
jgi:hypothetical protein